MNTSLVVVAAAAAVLVFLVGFGVWWLFYRDDTPRPAVAVSLVAGAVAAALVVLGGFHFGTRNTTEYVEFHSATEVEAWSETVECEKDGACVNTYQCEVYYETVLVPVPVTVPNGQGGVSTQIQMQSQTNTYYHACPYVKKELSYYVRDSAGQTHTYGVGLFPPYANDYVWTGPGSEESPGLPSSGSAVPEGWVAAKERIAAGTPGGTTVPVVYDNYLHATGATRPSSNDVDRFASSGLLPDITRGVTAPYFAGKVSMVGGNLPNVLGEPQVWEDELQRFNGRFWVRSKGDVRLVLVDSGKVPAVDSGAYVNALRAWWSDVEKWGEYTLPRNTVVVVVGVTSDGTVSWSDGFTGMPEGNEALVEKLREVPSTGGVLSPDEFLGKESVLENTVSEFTLVSMDDYSDLVGQVHPPMWGMVLILAVAVVVGCGVATVGFAWAADAM